MQYFKSNGKLLLTGEYAVLNGAKSLALPTKPGQSMKVLKTDNHKISWNSYDENQELWFQADFELRDKRFTYSIPTNAPQGPEAEAIAKRLAQILSAALELRPEGLTERSFKVETFLDFNRKWGLGTSSTLIYNLSRWLKLDPYQLLEKSFGGSGYDIAAAGSDHPITYQLTSNGPVSLTSNFSPSFKDRLFFVYLNRKQDSREAIAHYRNQPAPNIEELTEKISGITEQIIHCQNIEEFEVLLLAHESLISKSINLPRIQRQLFQDYPGVIKSLGGWGGDFILATGKEKEYFRNKGYNSIFDYEELIK